MMKIKANRGFTLIEVVFAILILVIGLTGVITVIPLGQRAAKDAAIMSRASIVANEKIAELKSYGYDAVSEDPPVFDLSGTKDDINWQIEITDVLNSDFEELVSLPIQSLKKLKVTVSYQVKRKVMTEEFYSFLARF